MNFITNTLKENMMLSCCLQTQTVQFMKFKIKFKIKVYLTLVTICKIESFLIQSIKKLLAKWKMNSKEKWLLNLLD